MEDSEYKQEIIRNKEQYPNLFKLLQAQNAWNFNKIPVVTPKGVIGFIKKMIG